jgi:predicted phosphodiesterase
MLFGAVGDLHGDFDALDRVMTRHPEVAFWVCPGDLATELGEYESPRAPLYWIKGNNENFDFVAAQPPGGGTLPNLFYIPNGTAIDVDRFRIAGLGGTFAPTWYETPPGELPSHASSKKDRRRHFVHAEVESCKALSRVDIFLSHEAARPFPLERVRDAGKTPINEVLSSMRPRVHLFGHHHRYTVAERQGVQSIGLELVTDSYLIFDGNTFAHERVTP